MDDLIKALETIKVECEKHKKDSCDICPFGIGSEECGIQEEVPSEWKIRETKITHLLL